MFKKKIKNRKIERIAFFGFADAKASDPLYKETFECAKFLAEKGFITVNGGGPGVMRAASEGAKAGGGKTIGVTYYPKDITNFEGRDPDNPLDKEMKKSNYLKRTLKLLELGDAYILFRGGTGTISEFGMAWGLARLYFGYHKPLILYGGFWENIIKSFVDNMRIRSDELMVYRIVRTPQEAFEAINSLEQSLKEKKKVSPKEKAFQLN